ncbi:hypothetical protein ES708_17035 [subsurface metagenome]
MCGAEATKTGARPKPGLDPRLQEYQCQEFKSHRWMVLTGRGQLAPRTKVSEKQRPLV